MEAYILLLIFIYFSYFLLHSSYNSEKANARFLKGSFVAIFLLCALRDYTVGCDIPGYIESYELSSDYKLWDASWVYMESGYVAYMKLLSMTGLSSRMFLAITYLIMIAPVYYSIKRYSSDPLLSVIIFVCFQFFTFDLSGIRQGLATSICLCGLPWIISERKIDVVKFVPIVILAMLFHRSSVIFLMVPLLVKLKYNTKNIIIMLIGIAVAPFLTEYVMAINTENHLSKYEMNENLKMFGTILFLSAIVIFMLFSCKQKSRTTKAINEKTTSVSLEQYTMLLIMSLIVSLAFNGTMLSRSSMFYTIFMVFGIPNAISVHGESERKLYRTGFHFAMLAFYYLFCLEPKVLNIVPYELGHDLLKFWM